MKIQGIILALAAATMSAATLAQDVQVGRSWARATVPQQQAGGAYLTLENKGKEADRLVAASTPVAASVELHNMSLDRDVMRMREIQAIEISPAQRIEMQPGDGYHLMLQGLKQPLKAGDRFPLTLQFERAGKVEVNVTVEQGRGGNQGRHGKH